MSDTNQRAHPSHADYPYTAEGDQLFATAADHVAALRYAVQQAENAHGAMALVPVSMARAAADDIERLHDSSNDWHKVADARALEILRLTDETADQARLLGMSGEREAGLRSEIERLQRTVTEMEIAARIKDDANLASRDLAELRPCYSIDGLTAFIAKHFPQMELRLRADAERPLLTSTETTTGRAYSPIKSCEKCGKAAPMASPRLQLIVWRCDACGHFNNHMCQIT